MANPRPNTGRRAPGKVAALCGALLLLLGAAVQAASAGAAPSLTSTVTNLNTGQSIAASYQAPDYSQYYADYPVPTVVGTDVLYVEPGHTLQVIITATDDIGLTMDLVMAQYAHRRGQRVLLRRGQVLQPHLDPHPSR